MRIALCTINVILLYCFENCFENISDRCILKHPYTADSVYYHYENGSKQAANLISGGGVGFGDTHPEFSKEQFRETLEIPRKTPNPDRKRPAITHARLYTQPDFSGL